ncbi:coiled-coil domain-containing protein [Clostridium sardiniense]|uniref:coiled-coil domain-containing protein n=1 Tax=Clostridium sardiniense TaxID=29369 RepID=UPI003D33A19B
MNIKLFENKIFRKMLNIVKHLGVFLLAMLIFTAFSLALPEQHVEVNFEKYNEIKNQEEKVSDEYNALNSEFEKKQTELLEKKKTISSDNEKMTQQIADLNKNTNDLNEEIKNLNEK